MTSSATASAAPQIEVVDEVASLLRERIFRGFYPAGHSLAQERVAAELGIGRTPTREALRLLEQEGLVEGDARGGVRVVGVDLDRLVAAYELREVLDGLAAQLAASRADRHTWLPYLDRLLAAEQRAAAAADFRAFDQSAADFHVAITHMADNKFLVSQAGLIRLTMQVLGPVPELDETSARRCVREHRNIRDAIEQGRPAEAEAAARTHVRHRLALLEATRPTAVDS